MTRPIPTGEASRVAFASLTWGQLSRRWRRVNHVGQRGPVFPAKKMLIRPLFTHSQLVDHVANARGVADCPHNRRALAIVLQYARERDDSSLHRSGEPRLRTGSRTI